MEKIELSRRALLRGLSCASLLSLLGLYRWKRPAPAPELVIKNGWVLTRQDH